MKKRVEFAPAELAIEMRSFPAVELVIFYRVFDNYVQIVRILNGRRDIESIFNNSPDRFMTTESHTGEGFHSLDGI